MAEAFERTWIEDRVRLYQLGYVQGRVSGLVAHAAALLGVSVGWTSRRKGEHPSAYAGREAGATDAERSAGQWPEARYLLAQAAGTDDATRVWSLLEELGTKADAAELAPAVRGSAWLRRAPPKGVDGGVGGLFDPGQWQREMAQGGSKRWVLREGRSPQPRSGDSAEFVSEAKGPAVLRAITVPQGWGGLITSGRVKYVPRIGPAEFGAPELLAVHVSPHVKAKGPKKDGGAWAEEEPGTVVGVAVAQRQLFAGEGPYDTGPWRVLTHPCLVLRASRPIRAPTPTQRTSKSDPWQLSDDAAKAVWKALMGGR